MKKIAKLGLLMVIFIIISFYPKNIYAKDAIIKINFKDKNFYNMIKQQLGDKILNKDDSNYIIDITKKDIEDVREISFDAKNLSLTESADINGIQRFIGLERLEFLNYKLEDISVLKYLPNLTELKINNCQLEDITALEELTNLKKLDLGYNQIKDITALEKLVNLDKLNLNTNQIKNIAPLKKLTKLTGLDLSSNQITDITSIAELTNLTSLGKIYDENVVPLHLMKLINFEYLYLGDNQISDISSIDENILQYTYAQKQKLLIKTNKKEVKLPNIFSKLYTNNEFELINCKLNSDKSKIIIDDIKKDASIKIKEGILKDSILNFQYDVDAPSLMINYGNQESNIQEVIVTVNSNEEIKAIDGWNLSDNMRKLTKTYTKNKTENIKVYDTAGNEANITIDVKNINRPILNFTYSVMNDMSLTKGEEIVAEADKYVGKVPYVLQGDSLIDGIDCSHFVYRILKICGVYNGNYIRSTKWINVGKPVESLDDAIAGDIIVWDGHVAIYDGKGKIIEAKGKKWGLTHDRDAANAIKKETYLGIRRFTGNEKIETIINPQERTDKDVKVTITSNKKIKPAKGWILSKDGKVLTKIYKRNANEVIKINDFDGNEVEANVNITNIYK